MAKSSSQVDDDAVASFPIPQRLNLFIVVVQLAAFLAIAFATARASAWWQLLGLAVAFAILGNSIYSIIHEAEHGLLHRTKWVNDTLGVLMALLFPAPFHLIRQGHLGHHRRNRSDDEAFDLYFDGDWAVLKWLILYGILTGCYWLVVVLSNVSVVVCPVILRRRVFAFDRPSAAFMESLNPRYWRLIQLEGLAAISLHCLIVWTFHIPLLHYAIVYFGFGFSWSAMQYVHHFGTPRHVLLGARNLRLCGPIDTIWLNHNWHLVHHEHPMVPWLYLPSLGRRSGDSPRDFLIWSYLKMWRGPRYTRERVENRYAGKVIQ